MAHAPSLKIGASGVRGVVGESLTPQLVTSFAAAFGTYAGAGPVLIGTDTRPSRDMVSQAAIAGLLSVGCTPVNLGIVPVPTLQQHVPRAKAVGGICVTASHNPAEWNALKLFAADGIVLRPNQFTELLDLYHQGVFSRVEADKIPEVVEDDTAPALHRDAVVEAVDAPAIRARKLKVAVDCCNGAASRATPEFLRALGCEVLEVHTDPDASFPRAPEPASDNLQDLSRSVRDGGADVGFALDTDADRLVLVDETGAVLEADLTVAIVVQHILARKPGPVVVNMSTSRAIDDIAAAFSCPVHRSKVGEIHVLERMFATGARVGGEGNGGVIVSDINPCRDSFVAMAHVLEALAVAGTTVTALRDRVPRYAMVKRKLACRPRDVATSLRLLRHVFREREVDLTDGLTVSWPDRWLHVRGSNTEPVIRINAEAREEETAQALVRSVLEYLRPTGE